MATTTTTVSDTDLVIEVFDHEPAREDDREAEHVVDVGLHDTSVRYQYTFGRLRLRRMEGSNLLQITFSPSA